jgi:hypothetical protein
VASAHFRPPHFNDLRGYLRRCCARIHLSLFDENEMNNDFNFDVNTYSGLDKLGRIPLSHSFHMREFLYSEVAVHYGLRNVPDNVGQAVRSGSELCRLLLEPLQDAFGRIHVRSGYRSRVVNQAGVGKHKCAEDNDGAHTWDFESASGHGFGAMACVSIPSVSRQIISRSADVSSVAWWIYDHLPAWSTLEFFAAPSVAFADEVTFNIGWHEKPMGRITTWRGGPRNIHDSIPDPRERKRLWTALLTNLG